MPQIIRTVEEIDAARCRAQKAAFAADDAGDSDETAEAVYGVLQWIFGDDSTDPTLEMAEDL
jgi:hypothetical protein